MGTHPILWRAAMSVDGGLIDADHRHLIDLINSFTSHRARDREALPHAIDTLNALKFYAETHFAREEALQRMVGYPEHERHETEHRELRAALDGMIARAERAPMTASVVEDLGPLLRRWLLGHTLGEDLKLKPYAKAMQRHAAALPPLRAVPR
jgi:hemerythrin